MFEKAIRSKVRWFYNGPLGIEDLYDLSVENLNKIYQGLNAKLRDANQDSLLDQPTKENETLELKINIIKHIVSVKLAEQVAREKEVERAAEYEKILAALEYQEDAELRALSAKELRKRANKLKS